MIFENNYAYAGTTAIIYNFEIDYSELGFYILEDNKIVLPSNSPLREIGIEYKKETDEGWLVIPFANNDTLNNIKNGSYAQAQITNTDTGTYLFSSPVALFEWNHMSPIRVVIKDLDESSTYIIRSYYSTQKYKYIYFNSCTVTTMQSQDIHYQCTEVTGDTDEHNEYLRRIINNACNIYNSMTAFRKSTAPSDNLNSKGGGNFVAQIDSSLLDAGAIAHSGMVFGRYIVAESVVCHEMAHNIMKDYIDETASEDAYNKIVKFMEFATHTHKATWRWNNRHNYPIISSATYNGVFNYLVAAACQVCRDASNLI